MMFWLNCYTPWVSIVREKDEVLNALNKYIKYINTNDNAFSVVLFGLWNLLILKMPWDLSY